jgi:antitoxin VapB
MGKEYAAKSFKSGNSVAIRMPAALGVEPEQEWTVVREDNGDLVIRSRSNPGKIDLSGIYGSKPGLHPQTPETRVMEGRGLDWHGERLKRD